ncbi:hypothetical protein ANCDUO_22010, partial [Ancylostoma duodenale]
VRNVASIASQEPAGPSMKTSVPGPASKAIKEKMDPVHSQYSVSVIQRKQSHGIEMIHLEKCSLNNNGVS